MFRILARVTTTAAIVLATVATAAAADAIPARGGSDIQRQVSAVMAAHPGGTVTAPGVVSWQHGAVTMGFVDRTAPSAITPNTSHVCLDDFYCFYADKDFNGAWLQFSNCDRSVGNLTDWGFNDLVSSYVNNLDTEVVVYPDINLRPAILFVEFVHQSKSYVGDQNNDKASSFDCPNVV